MVFKTVCYLIRPAVHYAVPGAILGTWLLWPTFSQDFKDTILLKKLLK